MDSRSNEETTMSALLKIKGVGPTTVRALGERGIDSVEQLAQAEAETVVGVRGGSGLIDAAKALLATLESEPLEAAAGDDAPASPEKKGKGKKEKSQKKVKGKGGKAAKKKNKKSKDSKKKKKKK
jgi:hypothetical protein